MEKVFQNLSIRYFLFISLVVLTTIVTQVVIHWYLRQEVDDARLINLASRQSTLGQRITKLALYIQADQQKGEVQQSRIDSLHTILTRWKNSHQQLLKRTNFITHSNDSLLAIQTNLIESISHACENIINTTDPDKAQKYLESIEANDLRYLSSIEQIAFAFQRSAEAKLQNVKNIEFMLAIISVFIISGGFMFILMPSVQKLRRNNSDLSRLNSEIQSQDEEIRNSFEQIKTLQSQLSISEKQYRERVEDAVDAIYESRYNGLFTYANQSMEKLTGMSHEDILKIKYYDLIIDAHKDEVINFYRHQFINKLPETYKEFAIKTKDGALIWVGQTVRMVFANERLLKVHAVVRDITVIKQAYLKLATSEQRFKALAEHATVGIHELNLHGEIVYMNKAWFDISGITPSFTMEDRIKAIHPDDRDKTIHAWNTAMSERREISLEFRFINPISGVVWVISRTSPVFNEQGELQSYIGTLSNITEIKETYLKLAKSEETYRLISTNAKDLITLYGNDDTAKRIYVSPSSKIILGYEPEELIGKSPFDIILPEDAKRMKETTHKDTLSGKPATTEYRIRRKDGIIIWMESSSHPFYSEKGEIVGFQTSAREITQRREIEQKLAESEKHYRLLSENTQDLIALHQPNGTYSFVSSSFETVLGYSPKELLGKSPYSFVHPDDYDKLRNEGYQKTQDGKQADHLEYRARKKDGTYLWLQASGQPIMDENNVVIAIQTSSRNISQRKAYESALIEAKLKAEDANKAKSLFLSVMSHEIRTPLNAILGLTNFMIDAEPPKRQLPNLKLLKYSGENLLTIINDILDFSKIESGIIDMEEISFDLIGLLENITKMMLKHAEAKHLTISLSYATNGPANVMGDPVRLNQVLVNLIYNALKFTAEGFVELAVEATPVGNHQYDLLFSVTDSGIGIDKDKFEVIFESFSQANKDTNRKYGGTGLGLAISKKLVTLMGGEIKLNSELGKGSCFYFTLRLKAGSRLEKKPKPLAYIDKEKKFSVLLVEDNEVNQVVVSNYLKKWGLHITYAMNGLEALEKIVTQSYHLVLMDMQMPEMDGYEATRRIRNMEDDYFKNIPILALTASAMTDKTTELLKTGLNDFVTKPFRAPDLFDKIFTHIHAAHVEVKRVDHPLNLKEFDRPGQEKKPNVNLLMVNNLKELSNAFRDVMSGTKPELFNRAAHKAQTTLALLNDPGFTSRIEDLETTMGKHPKTFRKLLKKQEAVFFQNCEQMIDQLLTR